MALIFKVAEEQIVPKWYETNNKISLNEAEAVRIASLPSKINEDELAKELDIIEARGSSGETYHYSSLWSDSVKNTIKEYAIVSNCKIAEVNPSDDVIQSFASLSNNGLQKTASVEAPVKEDSLDGTFLLDIPFTEKNTDLVDKEIKEGISKARAGMPAVEARGVTISRASSEFDDDNAGIGMRAGQGRNIIQDPNSIGRSVESKVEDVGVRLRRERLEREQSRIAQRKADQKAIAKEIEEAGYGAADIGNFRMTEAVEVQGKVLGSLSKNVEATEGEKISMRRAKEEKALADKKAEAKKQWDYARGSSKPSISDDLANALKAELGKLQ